MVALCVIFAVLAVFVATLLINTGLQTRNAAKLEGEHPSFTDAELETYGHTFSRHRQRP